VREWLLLLAQKKSPRKRQPNRVAYGSLEMNRFRRARSHSLLLKAALRASMPVDPPKSIHFQHTKRAIKKTVIPASEPVSIEQCLLHVPEIAFQ
jgi:hypothetical protein